MQMWLREWRREYAMNKPKDDVIYPNSRIVDVRLWPRLLPEELVVERSDGHAHHLRWHSRKTPGVEIRMNAEGKRHELLENVALIHTIHEIHRTHCPKCWRKFEGSMYTLNADMTGHIDFHCRADDDFDDRFPREG